ncbi:PTS sugar transporter subunit IIA [Simkania negevensis]|uniref:PTS system IIA protein n=1 Tax=Simkania negevensis (strain ATCC VR-1471 / DSM 27360 / Z) TaxID=331113 RepID=F8L4P4_SIMNZ|nr:PTS sugar transporter subunit IIA [Simkania negevensis]CCB88317.1 PTS system IIA protein [Simkania negevensis Z]
MAIRERISHLFKKGENVTLSELLEDGVICFLDSAHRDEALKSLVDALVKAGKILEAEAFFDAILKREKIVSTGIGMGVAIPHAKLEGFDHFFVAVGVQKSKDGIDWDALDGAPVKLIFMIGGPTNQQTAYLQILSRLTSAIKDEGRRRNLLMAENPTQIINLFTDC